MRRFMLLIPVITLLAARPPLQAQSSQDIARAKSALMEEVTGLLQDRVYPVMLQWKGRFDASLTPRDRDALESMRERYAMLQQNIRNNLEGRRAAWEKGDYRGFLSLRSLLETNFLDRRKLLNDAARLAARQPEAFAFLSARIDSSAEEWRGAAMRVFVDWFARFRGVITPAMNTSARDDLARLMLSCKNLGLDELPEHANACFLLWDGENFIPSIRETGIPESPLTDWRPDRGEILLLEPPAPNPFRDRTQIRFLLPAPADVTVRLVNTQGHTVRTLLQESLPVGKHLVTLEAEGLAPAGYYVLIDAGSMFDAVSVRVSR